MDTTSPSIHTRSRPKAILSTSLSSPSRQRHIDYVIGIILLLIVVFLWTSSNFITQALFENGYEKAFLVTYLNTSTFALYIVPHLVKQGVYRYDRRKPHVTNDEEYEPLATEAEPSSQDEFQAQIHHLSDQEMLPPLTTRETARLAGIFCIVWFVANWTLNVAVDYTSVASATVLSGMSAFFTMIIGRLFKVEVLTLVKIGAVLMSFGGTILVALSDNEGTTKFAGPTALMKSVAERPKPLLLGDALALTSALFYAIYTILLKVQIKSESRIDMKLFFGFVGIFNIISLWPIAILLHVTGMEKFELPSNSKAVGAVLLNMAITWSSDYLYVFAMLKTSPLVVTVGISLTMPLAVVGDFFLGRPVPLQVIAGALFVLAGVFSVGMEDARLLKKLEKEAEERAALSDDRTQDVELDTAVECHQ